MATSGFTIRFPAGDPAIRTAAGRKTEDFVSVDADDGIGLYGPWVNLPAGRCTARVKFEGLCRGPVILEFAAESAERILVARSIELTNLADGTAELTTELPYPLSACEVRLHCKGPVLAMISNVEFEVTPIGNNDGRNLISGSNSLIGGIGRSVRAMLPPLKRRSFSSDAISAHVLQLMMSIPSTHTKRAFLQKIDEFQNARMRELTRACQSPALAKLLLLKVSNLLVLKHGIHHRHTQLIGRPTQIKLDPSNTCQLQCPGCVHSPTAAPFFDWPRGEMALDLFDQIMASYGAFAFSAILHYYGEPLINRQFAKMVQRAKSLGLYTWTSSNLSLSFNIDAVVSSGLDMLTMSVDGTSQETLQHYRKLARYSRCLSNMKELVAVKHRLGRGPYLSWQFLTFEHNKHEVDTAIALAEEIGVDELIVVTPDDRTWDDPSVSVHVSPRAGHYVFNPDPHVLPHSTVSHIEIDEAACDRLLAESWAQRMERTRIAEEPTRVGGASCHWLYENATFDAHGRVMPCCMAPTHEEHVHFASLGSADLDLTNSDDFRLARLAFSDRPAFEAARQSAGRRPPYCGDCNMTPAVPVPIGGGGRFSVGRQLRCLDRERVFEDYIASTLDNWSAEVHPIGRYR